MKRALLIAAGCLAVGVPAALRHAGARAGEPGEAPAAPSAAVDLRGEYLDRSAAAKTAPERYALGLWCREKGLLPEAAGEMREAVRLDPENAAAREALGDRKVDGKWIPSDEAMERKGLVKFEGRWMLAEERETLAAPAKERVRRAGEEARARRLLEQVAAGGPREAGLAREALASVEDRCKVSPLAFALRAKSREVRLLAARELGRIGDRRTLQPLLFRALRDPDAEVRAACADAAKAFGDANILAPYGRALLTFPNPDVRAAAADAIGRSGDLRGVQVLVYSIEGHGGGPRACIYTANQLSFVQDFDVEVAQTAFIADPQVGILQDGVALDVKVISNEWYSTRVEREAIVGGLRRLTGAAHGDDPAAWRAWMKDNRERLAAAAK